MRGRAVNIEQACMASRETHRRRGSHVSGITHPLEELLSSRIVHLDETLHELFSRQQARLVLLIEDLALLRRARLGQLLARLPSGRG